jgi:protein-tyrosine phosphatase
VVRQAVLHRSALPVDLGETGQQLLRGLRLRTAVDLRDRREVSIDPPGLEGLVAAIEYRPLRLAGVESGQASGLGELYADILERRGPELVEAIRVLCNPATLPALVFCSAGKDRTGLVIGLVLSALGAAPDVVAADYARTGTLLDKAARAAARERALAAGMDEQVLATRAGAPPALMQEVLARLDQRHGGAEAYLRRHGLSDAELDGLCRGLVEPVPG